MKVFVITGSNGEYSDRNDWNICACYSEQRAQELVAKIEKLNEYNKEFKDRAHREFFPTYEKEHPAPEEPSRGRRRGGDTDDQLKWQEYNAWNREWYKNRTNAEEEWRKQNYHPPFDCDEVMKLEVGTDYSENHYGYQEIEVR